MCQFFSACVSGFVAMTLIEGGRATIPLLIVMAPLRATGARLFVVVVVMIVMIVIIVMSVVIVMMMMVFVAIVKQIGTHKIDAQTQERDRDCFAIGDRHRINEPHYGFVAPISNATIARIMALAKAARSPIFPVPKENQSLPM